MTPLVLRLPWPPKELSPNARPHWAVRQGKTRQYRSDCFYDAKKATEPRPGEVVKEAWLVGPDTVVTAHVVFVVPDKRKHDLDNAMAMLKPCWDGLVDAGLLVDDDSKHLRHDAPEMRVVKNERYVEVTLSHE